MPTRAVIFDVDGTLIDSVDQHAKAWVKALEHFGRPVDFAAVRSQIGKGGDQLMPVFLPADFIDRHGQDLETWRGELFKREYLPTLQAFPEVRALFTRLHGSGKRLVVASSAKADELDRYVEIAGVADLVDLKISSDDAERSKPAPDIFLTALHKGAIEPGEAVVVGDSPFDAQAAVSAGIRPVGMLCGGFASADLQGAGCIEIYQDPSQLLRDLDASTLA